MKNINISLSDTNYTHKASTDIDIKKEQLEILKSLVQKIEDGLFRENAAYLSINGLTDKQIKLTITEYEQLV